MTPGKHAYIQSMKHVKRCRQSVGMSLRQLSKATGVHFSTISRMERGQDGSAMAYCALVGWAEREVTKSP